MKFSNIRYSEDQSSALCLLYSGTHALHKVHTAEGRSRVSPPTYYHLNRTEIKSVEDLKTLLKSAALTPEIALAMGAPSEAALNRLGYTASELKDRLSDTKIARNRGNFEDSATSHLIIDIDGYDVGFEIDYSDHESCLRAVET